MAELTTSQIIKLILGMAVVVAVVVGASMYFKDVFGNFFGGDEENVSDSGEVDLSGYVPETKPAVKSPVLLCADLSAGCAALPVGASI